MGHIFHCTVNKLHSKSTESSRCPSPLLILVTIRQSDLQDSEECKQETDEDAEDKEEKARGSEHGAGKDP